MAFNSGLMILAAKTSIPNMLEQMSEGMVATVQIFVLTLLFSLPLGLIVAFGRMSKFTPLRWIVTVYISIMRGTPLMLQTIAIYFGPYFLFGVRLSVEYKFIAIIIAFSLNYAAYFAEIYRSGIESMPIGQYEAADLLGYNKFQRFIKIILPQVIKRILPSITNEVICLVKDTSLAYSVSFIEMFAITKQIASRDADFTPFIIAGIFFFIFNAVVAWVMNLFEKKYSYYQ